MAAQEASLAPVPVASEALPLNELQEYEKILKISDEIFSGTHPRLKVAEQFVKKATPRSPPDGPARASGSSQPQKDVQQPSQLKPNTTQTGSAPKISTSTPPAYQSSRMASKPSSELDPIFLEKSDGLLRAEFQLQRQRVEKVLRDRVDQRRQESKLNESLQESKPDFDVVEVLNSALEIVKPLASSDKRGGEAVYHPSDSSDEYSFYSSKAPDSSQHEEQILSEVEGREAPAVDVSTEMESVVDKPTEGQRVNVQTAFVADKPILTTQASPLAFTIQTDSEDEHVRPRVQEELMDEPEYIPPEPEVSVLDSRVRHEDHRHNSQRDRNQYYIPDRRVVPQSLSPNHDVSIVIRNHITSPAAPQPSRVSPLAMAKMAPASRIPQSHEHYQDNQVPSNSYSGRDSPDGPTSQLLPRKRRRMQESGRTSSYGTIRRPIIDSPGPHIKEEPMSPAPVVDAPSPYFQGSRPVQNRPVYVVDSPQYTPTLERGEGQKAVVYEVDRYSNQRAYESPVEASVSHSASRLSAPRPVRDQQDLRRVASLYNARNYGMARDIDASSTSQPRPMRAATYTIVERPPQPEGPRYYEDPEPPYARRYVRVDELAPSPGYRELGIEEEYIPRHSVITQRRVIVDEHGNRYYEDPTLDSTAEVIQPLFPRRYARSDDYHERSYVGNGNLREMSIVEDRYGERRYIQEMPPPHTSYRRVVDHPREIIEDRRPYSRMVVEREPVYRSSSTMVEYSPRQPTYIKEPELGRERLVRVSSVRPPPNRYGEAPRAVVHRLPSAHPSDRGEVSVYVDEDVRGHRNAHDRPVYTSTHSLRNGLSYEEDDAPRMVFSGDREVIRATSQRY